MKKFMFAVAVVVSSSLYAADKQHASVLQKISFLIRSSRLYNQIQRPVVCGHSLGGCNCGAAPDKR